MWNVTLRSGRKEILQHKYVSGPDDNPHRFTTSQINWNKKKAEVNCSFEDVEFSMQSNEDIRNWNNFSAVWSYCMEQTDRQLLCPTKMLLENRCPSATQCTQLGNLETQLAVWAPWSHPLDESPQTSLSNLRNVLQHEPSTPGFNFTSFDGIWTAHHHKLSFVSVLLNF